jgi:hypothetical protein
MRRHDGKNLSRRIARGDRRWLRRFADQGGAVTMLTSGVFFRDEMGNEICAAAVNGTRIPRSLRRFV